VAPADVDAVIYQTLSLCARCSILEGRGQNNASV
jgi:hypothetical protein